MLQSSDSKERYAYRKTADPSSAPQKSPIEASVEGGVTKKSYKSLQSLFSYDSLLLPRVFHIVIACGYVFHSCRLRL